MHHFSGFAIQESRHDSDSRSYGLHDLHFIVLTGAVQHIVYDFRAGARPADAETQTGEIFAQAIGDVPQAVMTTVAAALFQTHTACRQVQIIMRHQDGFRRQLEIGRERLHRLAAAVHEGGGFEQAYVMSIKLQATYISAEFALATEAAPMSTGKCIHKPEAGIVACQNVIGPGIAEADHELDLYR